MSTMTPVPKDSPLMIAWEAYKLTEAYANTKKWAVHAENTDGSLWTAFAEGYGQANDRIALLEGLLREWLSTELDSEDEEYADWIDSFTTRLRAAGIET